MKKTGVWRFGDIFCAATIHIGRSRGAVYFGRTCPGTMCSPCCIHIRQGRGVRFSRARRPAIVRCGARRRGRRTIPEGGRGLFNELLEAADRSRGGRVAIGQSLDPRGRADVIDHGRREALQIKTVTGGVERVIDNITDAAEQIRGEGGRRGRGGEVPLPGYLRIVKIIIDNPNNPMFPLDRAALRQALIDNGVTREMLTGPDGATGAQQLQVVNGTSSRGAPHTFTPTEFP